MTPSRAMGLFNLLPRRGVVLPDGHPEATVTKITRICSLLFTAAALCACGNSGTTDEFRAAAPTLEKLAISQNDGDAAEATVAADPGATAVAVPDCHPHLFVRTHEIIG